MRGEAAPSRQLSGYLLYAVCAIVLCIVLYVRIRLLSVPLERDEGEFAYVGQLLLKGINPFSIVNTMKLPGVGTAYAFFMLLFGQTPEGIRLGLLIVNILSAYILYLLAKRLFDSNTALLSCASYALLSISQSVLGVFAHATHFVVLFALAGFLLLMFSLERNQKRALFSSGLCFGLAFIMKQHAIIFIIFAFLYLLRCCIKNPALKKKNFIIGVFLFLFGIAIPYFIIVSIMFSGAVFDKFWFWTVSYAGVYASSPTILQGIRILASEFSPIFSPIALTQPLLWFLAGIGSIVICASQEQCKDRLFIIGFIFISFLSICPGFYFRNHYFIMLLPAVALMTGVAANSAAYLFSSFKVSVFQHIAPSFVLFVAISHGIFHEKDYLFTLTPTQICRTSYGANPFPEAIRIGDYIKQRTSPDDTIAVLGSEPEVLFYSDRLSATSYIYMYEMMENQPYAEKMQLQMIHEIEAAKPAYIVDVNINASWLAGPDSPQTLMNWKADYIKRQYVLVGAIDILGPDFTRYLWDSEIAGYIPNSSVYFLTIYKRVNALPYSSGAHK